MNDRWLIPVTIILLVLVAVVIAFCSPVRAHDAHERPQLTGWAEEQVVTPEYGKRMGCAEPDKPIHARGSRNNSCYCCDKSEVLEGKDAEFRLSRDRVDEKFNRPVDEWWYRRPGEEWRRIPDDAIHWDEHSPTGQPVLFIFDGHERCFFPADWVQ